MDNDKWIGIACLISGLFFLRWTFKNWVKGSDIFVSNAKGILGSISLIMIGIAFLLGKLHW